MLCSCDNRFWNKSLALMATPKIFNDPVDVAKKQAQDKDLLSLIKVTDVYKEYRDIFESTLVVRMGFDVSEPEDGLLTKFYRRTKAFNKRKFKDHKFEAKKVPRKRGRPPKVSNLSIKETKKPIQAVFLDSFHSSALPSSVNEASKDINILSVEISSSKQSIEKDFSKKKHLMLKKDPVGKHKNLSKNEKSDKMQSKKQKIDNFITGKLFETSIKKVGTSPIPKIKRHEKIDEHFPLKFQNKDSKKLSKSSNSHIRTISQDLPVPPFKPSPKKITKETHHTGKTISYFKLDCKNTNSAESNGKKKPKESKALEKPISGPQLCSIEAIIKKMGPVGKKDSKEIREAREQPESNSSTNTTSSPESKGNLRGTNIFQLPKIPKKPKELENTVPSATSLTNLESTLNRHESITINLSSPLKVSKTARNEFYGNAVPPSSSTISPVYSTALSTATSIQKGISPTFTSKFPTPPAKLLRVELDKNEVSEDDDPDLTKDVQLSFNLYDGDAEANPLICSYTEEESTGYQSTVREDKKQSDNDTTNPQEVAHEENLKEKIDKDKSSAIGEPQRIITEPIFPYSGTSFHDLLDGDSDDSDEDTSFKRRSRRDDRKENYSPNRKISIKDRLSFVGT